MLFSPPMQTMDGFSYTRKNVSDGIVSYLCTYNRGSGCKAQLKFKRSKSTGIVDFSDIMLIGEHSRKCVVRNGM